MSKNIAKHEHTNNADPSTHLDNSQAMGRYTDVATGINLEQYAEARHTEQSMT